MHVTLETEVAIVGLGPVGATLANLLANRGIDVVAIEKDAEVHPKPRAVTLDHEAIRSFQGAGLADRVLPHTILFQRSVYRGVEGQIIKQLVTAPPPYQLGWCPNYLFSQPIVDSILRDAAAERPGVTMLVPAEVSDAWQDAEGVTLEVRHADDTSRDVRAHVCAHVRAHVRAKYVVACDGASSPMRRRLGIGLDDLAFEEPWLVVDALIDEAHLPNLPATTVQYCEPSRPATHVRGPGNHRRWEIMMLPGETPEEINREERIWQLLSRWINPGNAKLWRAAAYRFHALIAHDWHQGRIILAGDAAHMTPPFLGQGMCQGLRDAANIAWKLEYILKRGAPAAPLLATYMQERGPHVRATTEVAKALGRIICELDPVKAAARDARLLDEGQGREEIRQSLIPDLSTGILSMHSTGTAVGSIFPQPKVRYRSGEALLDDVTGSGFRLVGRHIDLMALTLDPLIEKLSVTLCSLGTSPVAPIGNILHVEDCDGLLTAWLDRHGTNVALVRPDHYVFGTATDVAGARALVEELASMLFPGS